MTSAGWIKWEKGIEEDPRFKRMVNRLRYTSVTSALPERTVVSLVTGCLLKFWSYADSYIRADDTLDLGAEDVDALVGLPGFAEAMPDDWIRIIDSGNVELPNYQEHSGTIAKRKALNQKRVQKHRKRTGNGEELPDRYTCNDGALPDQTRPDQKEEQHTRGVLETNGNLLVDEDVPEADPGPPPGLDHAAWNRWLSYRKQTRKPLKPASIRAAQESLAAFGSDQAAVVTQSIANGYQGLFELKSRNGSNKPKEDPPRARGLPILNP